MCKVSSVCLAVKVLRGPQKLPTPQAAAYKSVPEAQMVGRRIALAEASSPAPLPVCFSQCMISILREVHELCEEELGVPHQG